MRNLILRLVLPMLVLLLLEMAFRAGVWEGLTPENSNAGKSVRVIRGLASQPNNIDFVTIGDSRAKHGLDHQLIAETAQEYGYSHAKLTIPGSHMLVESLLVEWLKVGHPNVQGGVIATSVPALLAPRNGDHEIAMAQPLSKIFQRDDLLVDRFSLNRPSSWGAISSLYSYREDVQDFIKAPQKRLRDLKTEDYSHQQQLFGSKPGVPNVCRVDWSNLASCAAYSGGNARGIHIAGLCALWLSRVRTEPHPNPDRFTRQQLFGQHQAILDSRQAQFRSINWPKPPVVVLMPVSHLWYQELAPDGADEWAHKILDPLVEEGIIRLLDYSHFFDTENGSRCDAYTDPYHQSALGMKELTADILPKLEAWLYSSD